MITEAVADELPCGGRLDAVRLDPAAVAKSSLGPAANGEYERLFGSRLVARWPQHQVLDGLDTVVAWLPRLCRSGLFRWTFSRLRPCT